MSAKSQTERIIFGLKIKQLRQKKALSFAELSEQTGMSVSYLNEIEKGKKYPREDKIQSLAHILGVTGEELTSATLDKSLQPVTELLQSNFLNELPLELFGVELAKVVEIIASAPTRVGAFISTLLEISRNYAFREENFYFSALRSYLELHNNYFEDIENKVAEFCQMYQIPTTRPLSSAFMAALLEQQFGYTIIHNGLDAYPELQHLRAVLLPKEKKLLLHSQLTHTQRVFQFGKELGFHLLGLQERAYTSSLLRSRTFEEVLNRSRATYFSVALLLPQDSFLADVQQFFARPLWDGSAFLALLKNYAATPEMLYHRLTNVLPRFFGLDQLFFLRFVHDPTANVFEMDKELHLSRRHHPHGNALLEHYCRRWVALSVLQDLQKMQHQHEPADTLVRIQRSRYIGTDDEYLSITLARAAYPTPNRNVSVTLGLHINADLRSKVAFLDDPAIPIKDVNQTCERCALSYCAERAAPPLIVEKKEQLRQIQHRLKELMV
ncbi:MAG TPA: helix-turn-helix domain-containing protein [Saprospiraceae bacterium]|nr:helix-turn-helix domain-containing protein [Saprospiraceae bacterium]